MTRAKSSQPTGKTVDALPVVKVNRKRAALGDVSNQTSTNTVGLVSKSVKAAPLRSKLGNVPEVKTQVKKVVSKVQRLESTTLEEPPTKQRKTIPSSPEAELQSTTLPSRVETPPPKLQDWDDLDADDMEDPLMVSEYVVEIFNYLREQELVTLPTPDYMDRQKDLHWKMRGILVDWLVEVHQKFRLLPETLFLAVNIIDRFLSLRVCSLPKLQLVGITALFIASKYEEVMCPSIQNFIYMADGGYTDDEILKAEQYVCPANHELIIIRTFTDTFDRCCRCSTLTFPFPTQ